MGKSKSKGKSKGKARKAPAPRPVVAGPQLNLPAGVKEGRTPIAAEHHTGERLRYLEAPRKRKGNPFIAARVPRELDEHWRKWCKAKGKASASAMREALAKLSGFKGDLEGGEDDGE